MTPLPLSASWLPGPARGGPALPEPCLVGDRYLTAVEVRVARYGRTSCLYDLAIVTASECGFDVDGEPWGWDWDDVSWYVPAPALTAALPPVEQT